MVSEHIVKAFDEDLGHLDNLIAEMGGRAEAQLADATSALVHHDTDAARRVLESDRRLDDLEVQVDALVVRLLALRQPMADDLRIIVAALKVASNLERIGDYAKNVAKRSLALSDLRAMSSALHTIERMSGLAQSMVNNVVDAYVGRDADRADDVRRRDKEVDRFNTSLFRELVTYMLEDPRSITACTHLLFIAKNLERVGDHSTSIAEQTHFMVHGRMPEDERFKDDQSSQTIVELD